MDRCACCGAETENYLCGPCAFDWYERPKLEREERRRKAEEKRREQRERLKDII